MNKSPTTLLNVKHCRMTSTASEKGAHDPDLLLTAVDDWGLAKVKSVKSATVKSGHSALVHIKAHGKVLLRKILSQLAQSQ